MMPTYYDRERSAQAHRQNLLREADHERLLAQLPRPNRRLLPFLAKLTPFLKSVRMRLRQGFRRREQPVLD